MEPLYTTTATNTYEEYKRYFNTLSKLKLHIILYCVLSVYLAVLSLYLRWIHTLVFAIVFPVLVIALQLLQRSRIFKTNKILQNTTVTYEFFDTFFTNSHQLSCSSRLPGVGNAVIFSPLVAAARGGLVRWLQSCKLR